MDLLEVPSIEGGKKVKEMEEKNKKCSLLVKKKHITAYCQRSSRVSYLMFILCMLTDDIHVDEEYGRLTPETNTTL